MGEFQKHKRHGKGVLTTASGDRYDGEWINNQRNGFGIQTYADGSSYEGVWQGDVPHGKGKKYDATTQITYDGIFEFGTPSPLPAILTVPRPAVSEEEEPPAPVPTKQQAGKGRPVSRGASPQPPETPAEPRMY